MGTIKETIENIQQLWGDLDTRAKVVIIAGTFLVVAILGYLIFAGSGTQYTPLYTDIVSQDASAIVNSLEEKNIPYQLSDNGTTISVPSEQVHKVRLDLAAEGLPNQGVVGFEIFDNSQFGDTDFERKVNYYRAIGGELSRSIQEMNGVNYAKVQITAPKDSLYLDEQVQASASVLLEFDPGFRIQDQQVVSIANLVASSVQDLASEDVAIVDTNGNLLSDAIASGGGIGQQSETNLGVTAEFENGLEKDLTALLTKVLGPGNFSVNVNAQLNFDHKEVESKTYTPVIGDEGIVRSQETVEESESVNSAEAGGAAGTGSNIPEYQEGTDGANQSSEYEKSSNITNYEINEQIERYVYSGGDIEQLSVSVMVNNNEDQELLNKIKESIQAAIGYDEERGDVVTVNNFNFDNSIENQIAEERQQAEASENRRMYIYGGLIALILIILVVLIITIKRSLSEPDPSQDHRGQMINYLQENQEQQAGLENIQLTEEEEQKKKLKEDLEDAVTGQPENAAKLLKSWLSDE